MLKSKNTHLIFYDGKCGLCDRVVQFVLKHDVNHRFLFAPLQGQTASQCLKNIPTDIQQQDSLIFIENFLGSPRLLYSQGKAVFRILWLLGGWWRVLGVFNFFPSFLYDWLYRFIARNRKKISFSCSIHFKKDYERFLP